MIRKFWWGSKNGEKKVAWVSWSEMAQPKHMGGLGFRDIELFNLAMLAKQAWRLLQDENSLIAKILKAVYYPNTDFLEAGLGSTLSQVWREIVEGRYTLKLGLIRRIGTGETTKVWEDNWLPTDYNLRPILERSATPPDVVSELIVGATNVWNI